MPSQNPYYHGRQAIEMSKITDGLWVWKLNKSKDYKYGRKNVFSILSQANHEIIRGRYNVPEEWFKQYPDNDKEKADVNANTALSGITSASLSLPAGYIAFELKEINDETLKNTRLIVLQNFNVSLDTQSPLIQTLRDFVNSGGRLMLTHDTPFFMPSPFPKICKGYLNPDETGDGRHILDTLMNICHNQNIIPQFKGESYTASFNDHLALEPGNDGNVIVRDKYNYPVIIAGTSEKGKVIFCGSYYNKVRYGSMEQKILSSLIDWLVQ